MDEKAGFTAAERRDLLERCFPEMRRFPGLSEAYGRASGAEEDRLRLEIGTCSNTIKETWKAYKAGLPQPALSRCPFTGEPWVHSFDPFGLDGLWWNADRPMRAFDEPQGGKYFCFTGAVKLFPTVEVAPFLCRPGPEVPFVVPRILSQGSVKGVLHGFGLGRHDAYLIVYFASSVPRRLQRTDDWGVNYCEYRGEDGKRHSSQAFDDESDYDFEIAPWIESGKLLWIGRGDPELTLRSGTAGCPYLSLPGRRSISRIRDGEVWWSDEA